MSYRILKFIAVGSLAIFLILFGAIYIIDIGEDTIFSRIHALIIGVSFICTSISWPLLGVVALINQFKRPLGQEIQSKNLLKLRKIDNIFNIIVLLTTVPVWTYSIGYIIYRNLHPTGYSAEGIGVLFILFFWFICEVVLFILRSIIKFFIR